MKNKKIFIIVIVIIILAISTLIYFFNYNPTNYDNFAKCLTSRDAKFFGAFWCSHCAEQKSLFGKSIKYVNYIECDSRGENAQPELCQKEEIVGYPTWKINGTLLPGLQPLERLSQYSECKLNN
jgi:hypothetical protein